MKTQVEREFFGTIEVIKERNLQNDGIVRQNIREAPIQDRLVKQVVLGNSRLSQNRLRSAAIVIVVGIVGAVLVIVMGWYVIGMTV